MAINLGNLQQMAAVHANSRTLRGLLALESGDTAKAAELFAEALRIAGPDVRFSDRTIAERYLELLRAQK
jgi:Tfp pilus assembly protein PilF